MTDFKPGDRVRLSAAANPRRRQSVNDSEGTVYTDGYSEPGRTSVTWDNGSVEDFPYNDEIELVAPREPAADPDLQALRERLLALAVESANFTGDDVVETAKAFEAYVTGGTK